jgi:hypothetical protein
MLKCSICGGDWGVSHIAYPHLPNGNLRHWCSRLGRELNQGADEFATEEERAEAFRMIGASASASKANAAELRESMRRPPA